MKYEFKFIAVTHDESDDDFINENGDPVDVVQSVCDAWNDMQVDYHNFSIHKIGEKYEV